MKKVIRLTENDLTRIVKRVINETSVINTEMFKSYGDQKLKPLGFRGFPHHKNNSIYIYDKNESPGGTWTTNIRIFVVCESDKKVDVSVTTYLGHYNKTFDNIKGAIDEAIYLDNLMIKNFKSKHPGGDKTKFWNNPPLKLEVFDKTLLERGFKKRTN